MSLLTKATRTYIPLHKSFPAFTEQKRYNTREAIHRYVEPDKFKKHMLAAAEPYKKRKYVLPSETCKGVSKTTPELHPLQKIYANELVEAINANDFMLFIQHNYTPFQSERVYKNTLMKSGGLIYAHRNVVYREAFDRLEMSILKHLCITRNTLVLGPLKSLAGCVKSLKKMPQFLLLAGCIDKELYSNEQLQLISNTPNLDQCLANLVAILETPGIDMQMMLEYLAREKNSTKEEAATADEVDKKE